MPESITSDTTVQRLENGKVKHSNDQSQIFGEEEYVQVYNDTIQQLETMQNQLEQIHEQKMEALDKDGMLALHTILAEHEQDEKESLEVDAVSEEVMQDYQELQQNTQQEDQLKQQIQRVKSQAEEMQHTAQSIAEDHEDLEASELPESSDEQ